jgi:uncharacterized protein
LSRLAGILGPGDWVCAQTTESKGENPAHAGDTIAVPRENGSPALLRPIQWTREKFETVTTCYTELSVMAISKDLLEILVCPLCKETVELKPDGSGLKCVKCHRVYPVRDDIPVMLIDEAKVEE